MLTASYHVRAHFYSHQALQSSFLSAVKPTRLPLVVAAFGIVFVMYQFAVQTPLIACGYYIISLCLCIPSIDAAVQLITASEYPYVSAYQRV